MFLTFQVNITAENAKGDPLSQGTDYEAIYFTTSYKSVVLGVIEHHESHVCLGGYCLCVLRGLLLCTGL